MTVSSSEHTVSYAGNGSTKTFAVPFYFLETDHLQVVLRSAAGVDTVQSGNYTVLGAGNPAGGSVTMTTAPASGATLIITRAVPETQETDYVPNDPFAAESHEKALDKLTMLGQQLRRDIDRAVRVPLAEAGGPDIGILSEIPTVAQRANKFFIWDASGQPDVVDSGIGDITGTIATFGDRAAVQAADINTVTTKVINVGGYATYGDGGDGLYKLVAVSTWPDGEVVDAGGHIWQLLPERGAIRAEQLGVVADGNFYGTTGTINNAAIDRVIAAPVDTVLWPVGGVRFTETKYPRATQTWIGSGPDIGPNNLTVNTVPKGTCFVYSGSGNRAAFWGEGPTSTWTNNLWQDLSVATGYHNNVDGANGTDCEWLFYAYHARGTKWDHIWWRHHGGHFGTIPATSVSGSYGCVGLDGQGSGATWYHEFWDNEFFISCSRVHGPMGDTANYKGYAWGAFCYGNDVRVEGSHFNGSSIYGGNGGDIHLSNCNFENGDWGSEVGFATTATERAAIVITSKSRKKGELGVDEHSKGLTLSLAGSTKVSQYTYAIAIDASYHTGTTECNLSLTGGFARRNRTSELLMIQNSAGTCSGGAITNTSNTTRDVNETDDVDAPGIGKATPIRVKALASNKTDPAYWPGMRRVNNNVLYPEVWDDVRGVTAAWWPRHNSTTVDSRGVAPSGTGTESTAEIAGNTFAAGWPLVTRTSVNTGDAAAEFHAAEWACVRGASSFLGGHFNSFIFSCPSVIAGEDRAFVGLLSMKSAISATTEPTSLTQMFGVGFDSTDPRNWHFISGGNTVQQHVDLGSGFPADDPAAVYQLLLWTEGVGNQIVFMMMRLDASGFQAFQSFNVTNGPAAGQQLSPHFFRARKAASANASVAVRLYGWECRAQPYDWLGSRLRSVA